MSYRGKIGHLPKEIIEQLNRRLDDEEPGENLVAWLNSLPAVQTVLQSEFEGRPISEQNLSQWRTRGYRHWQRRQERRELFDQLQTSAADVGAATDSRTFHRQASVALSADLALAIRQVLDDVEDPDKRVEALTKLVGKFAQLRREESNALRVQIDRERWQQELAEAQEKRLPDEFTPEHALFLQRQYIDTFTRPSVFPNSEFRTPHSCDPTSIKVQSKLNPSSDQS